jgi:hypothetical protein
MQHFKDPETFPFPIQKSENFIFISPRKLVAKHNQFKNDFDKIFRG